MQVSRQREARFPLEGLSCPFRVLCYSSARLPMIGLKRQRPTRPSVMQLGFGWTNGVALQLLDQYGATLTSGSGSGRLWGSLLCLVIAVAPLLL